MPKKRLVTLLGPTASGKTSLAIKLAKVFDGEIVCADSRTVYKGMDIGTAKPTLSDQKAIKHHLLDVASIDTPISAAKFKQLATKAIADIQARKKLPLLVGGSGMYIDAILYDYTFRDAVDQSERDAIKGMGLEQLQTIAKAKYPNEYENIDRNNQRRVEQLLTKGPSKDKDRKRNIDSLVLGLDPKSLLLRQNIVDRTKSILNNDFVQEVENLYSRNDNNDILLSTTGYAQVVDYLNGRIQAEDLEDTIVNATWQLSRKQMTWFRRNTSIKWLDNSDQAEIYVSEYLKK